MNASRLECSSAMSACIGCGRLGGEALNVALLPRPTTSSTAQTFVVAHVQFAGRRQLNFGRHSQAEKSDQIRLCGRMAWNKETPCLRAALRMVVGISKPKEFAQLERTIYVHYKTRTSICCCCLKYEQCMHISVPESRCLETCQGTLSHNDWRVS